MNILIPHTWLLEHLETKAKPESIQEQLSLSGPSVERIYDIASESVYDIELTTNRVDAMNVHGVAREAAVILQQAGIEAELKPLSIMDKTALQLTKELPIPKVFNHPKLNQRTIFIILTDVQRTPTPKWMTQKLTQIGQNIHHAAIDITNYVTHDIGHPIHAFDYDKLMATGGEIHIAEAEKGENFTTLDGETFEAVGGEVVFKNSTGQIIDLPSIKGTANTSIDESTRNVLLLAESISPKKVRFASMTHAIRTTAAQLMEKGADPHLAEPTLLKAVELYQQLCGAGLGSRVVDEFPHPQSPPKIKVSLHKIAQYLGLKLSTESMVNILTSLECEVSLRGQGRGRQLEVTPPTFRSDLRLDVDVIEEIARIYGYHQLPSTLMTTAIPTQYPTGTNFELENKIKYFLAHIGWQEVFTYSLVSQDIALQAGYKLDDHLQLANPLTEDRVYLRRSLLPSLEEVIADNSQREELSIFELANTYQPQKNKQLPIEKMQLALTSTLNYRQVRGTVESLLDQFFVTNYKIKPTTSNLPAFTQTANILAPDINQNQLIIGHIGVLKSGRVGAVIVLDQLLMVINTHPAYQAWPKTMPVSEDLTFTLPIGTAVGPVIETMQQVSPLISRVELKDIFEHNHTFSIQYHDPQHNLSTLDVGPVRQKIVRQVETQHRAQLVGEV